MTKILCAPLHSPSARGNEDEIITAINRYDPDSVGFTEGYTLDFHKDGRYRQIMETGGKDKRRGQYDIPILTKRNLRSYGSGQFFGCDAAAPLKLAPERWFTFSSFSDRLTSPVTTHINFHPHAAVQEKIDRRIPRIREYKAQMEVFRNLLQFYQKMGSRIVVTADFNWRNSGSNIYNPWDIMKANGLAFGPNDPSSIIGVGWSQNFKNARLTQVPGVFTDHNWYLFQGN